MACLYKNREAAQSQLNSLSIFMSLSFLIDEVSA